jgi:hypothetical protein
MRLLRGAMNRLRSMPDAQAESAKDRCGSGHAGRLPGFTAEKRALKLCFPEAADRH